MSAIRRSAKGEECQIRMPGICNGNRETVVWCHANGSAAGKGIGMKSPDYLGAYGCSNCHDEYDRRNTKAFRFGHSREKIELWFWEGHARSLILLEAKGLLSTKRAA